MSAAIYSSRARIWLSRILALAFLVVLLFSRSVWATEAPNLKTLLTFIGFILVGVGVVGRAWAGSYICGFKNTKLMDFGPYSMTRNPLYFFSFVGMVGITLITGTFMIPAAFIIIFFLYYIPVMKKEERHLKSLHDANFDRYITGVPRFWPKFSLYHEPETYTVTSSYYRKFLLEVIWFIFVAALINLLSGSASIFSSGVLSLY